MNATAQRNNDVILYGMAGNSGHKSVQTRIFKKITFLDFSIKTIQSDNTASDCRDVPDCTEIRTIASFVVHQHIHDSFFFFFFYERQSQCQKFNVLAFSI